MEAPLSNFIESFAAIRDGIAMECMRRACFQSSHDANEFILFYYIISGERNATEIICVLSQPKIELISVVVGYFFFLVSLAGHGDDKRATIELIHDDGKGPIGKRIVTDHGHSTCFFFRVFSIIKNAIKRILFQHWKIVFVWWTAGPIHNAMII